MRLAGRRASWCRWAGIVALAAGVAATGRVPARAESAAEPPGRFRGEVVRVIDGDSVAVRWDGGDVEIRLRGIDAPELAQPGGDGARDALRALADHQPVRVVGAANDRYGRRVAEVLLGDGRSLSRLQVAAGHAWYYRRYADDPTLAALEAWAREERRGLWGRPDPQPPWDFRHRGRGDGRAPRRTAEPAAGGVIGNRQSGVYHLPGCPGHDRVAARNRVPFASASAAEAAGFRRAGNCPR